MFNSLDPSPFVERDLDADAEDFIMSWARELPRHDRLELVLHLAAPPQADRAAGVEEAVQHYFATRAEIKRREFGFLMRRGRTSLIVGLVFLAVCLTLDQFLGGHHSFRTGIDIVKEGLVIAGWVAMWRPLEIYLYDWWPLWEERQILARLARMKVKLVYPGQEIAPLPAKVGLLPPAVARPTAAALAHRWWHRRHKPARA